MKKIFTFLLIALMLMGCTVKTSKENLEGTWEIVSYEATQANFPYLTDEVKEANLATVFVLNENSSFEILKDSKTIDKTTWKIKNDKGTSYLSKGTQEKKYVIARLTRNTMMLIDTHTYTMTDIIIKLDRKK